MVHVVVKAHFNEMTTNGPKLIEERQNLEYF